MIFLEKIINHYFNLDPASRERVNVLYDKKIVFDLTGLDIFLQFIFSPNGVKIEAHKTLISDADLIIQATPLNLLQFKLRSDKQALLKNGIQINGNLSVAQDLLDFFNGIEIDWEEHFSKIIGDLPAFYTLRTFKKINQRAKKICHNLILQLNEYFHEEVNWFPAKEALDDFYNDIDEFRMQVDRLSARTQLLRQKYEIH